MPITGRDRYYASKEGRAGFSARSKILDNLISQSLAKNRSLRTNLATIERQTSLDTARIGAESGKEVAEMQQEGLTARQKLMQAGDYALQQLQGKQSMEKQTQAESAELNRIATKAEEDRETKEYESSLSSQRLDHIINLITKKKKEAYSYDPDSSGVSTGDEEYDQMLDNILSAYSR